MGRARIYATDAERQRAYRERCSAERAALLARAARPPARHPRHAFDHYETPPAFIAAALALVTREPASILDPGAGDGRFGQAAKRRWPRARLTGVELRPIPPPAGFDFWLAPADFLQQAPHLPPSFDLVLGNPPYRHTEAFVRAGLSRLSPGGELVFLLPLAFLGGQARAEGLFTEHPLAELAACSRRPRFYGKKAGSTVFAFFRWQKGYRGDTRQTTAFIAPRDG